MTTHRGVPITVCAECHREHPQGKRHCVGCARWRAGRTVELNPGYFLDSVKYFEAEERANAMPTLFDLTGDAA